MNSPSKHAPRPGVWGTIASYVAGPRTKWMTLAFWIVLVAVLSLIFPSVNKQEDANAAALPASVPSVQATAKMNHAFPSASGTPALIVWYRQGGLTTNDIQNIQTTAKVLTAHPVAHQKSVVPLDKMPASAVQNLTSKDGTTLVLPVTFASESSSALKTSLAAVQQEVRQATATDPFKDKSMTTPGLHARITGPAGIATDAIALFQNADITLLAATTLLVLALLIVLYRSPILAFVPLISVGFAYGTVSPLLGILAKSGIITVDAQGASIMTVLLFGAGTDYCLFLVARFRERLLVVEDKYQAMREAIGGAAGAIAMSGLTVVLSLLALLFARELADHRFAIPFSLAILIMALVGVTLLPALLAIFGRFSFFPFVPRTEAMQSAREEKRRRKRHGHHSAASETRDQQRSSALPLQRRAARPSRNKDGVGRLSRFVGHLVSQRPWVVMTSSVIALAILAGFSTQIKTTYNLLGSFPASMPSRQGYTVLSQHFPPGTLAPVSLLVQTNHPTDGLKSNLTKLPFVATVSNPTKSTVQPDMERLQLTLKDNPYSNAAMADIPVIRKTAQDFLTTQGLSSPGTRVWIAGETATQYDTKVLSARDTRVVIPIVIAIVAILLLLYLKSVLAMFYLILSVLLSYFSALGTGWIVLHEFMGVSAMAGAIPLYAFVFLVALGEDYNIFMVSRIWQARRAEGRPLGDAVSEGVSRTSGVITSAGLILAGTFAVLASLPIQILVQFGIVTAIGVLLDTFVVRPFVVPSITAIVGKYIRGM